MTALTEYDRLEASGQWRPSAYQQRRDVVVSVGDATLAIMDMQERPLAHWSLPAIERRNPGQTPAIYAPGPDAQETLEIEDSLMIESIERVQMAVARGAPRSGRLRTAVLTLALAGLVAAGIWWLPDAVVRHASEVVPPAIRADTGARLLSRLTDVTGAPCRAESARAPLDAFARRLLGNGGGQIVVLPDGVSGAMVLPGRIVVLDHALIENHDGPEPAAGHVLAALTRAATEGPTARLLRLSGPRTAIHLLTQGEIPDHDLDRYAETLLSDAPPRADSDALATRARDAGISLTSYFAALEQSSGPTQDPAAPETLVSSDPQILTDGQWVALQSICGG